MPRVLLIRGLNRWTRPHRCVRQPLKHRPRDFIGVTTGRSQPGVMLARAWWACFSQAWHARAHPGRSLAPGSITVRNEKPPILRGIRGNGWCINCQTHELDVPERSMAAVVVWVASTCSMSLSPLAVALAAYLPTTSNANRILAHWPLSLRVVVGGRLHHAVHLPLGLLATRWYSLLPIGK
jgi:hypothetical protein